MRLLLPVLATILLALLLAYAAWLFAPSGTNEISYVVTKPVFETKTREVGYVVRMPDGKLEHRVFTLNYTVSHAVPEKRIKTFETTPTEKLRWWVLVGCAVLCAVYSVFVLGAWMKLTFDHQSKGKRRLPAMEKRLNSIMSFGFGAIAGVLAVSSPGIDIAKEQALADIVSLKQELQNAQDVARVQSDQYQENMDKIMTVLDSAQLPGSVAPESDSGQPAEPAPTTEQPPSPE